MYMRVTLGLLLVMMTLQASSQISTPSGTICHTQIVDGDTLVLVMLDVAFVSGPREFSSERQRKKYERLERKVIKVYPYAYAAGVLMKEYEQELASLRNDRERKRYLKEAEDALKRQFEGELRNMTVSEGVLLIKLIDRQTGDTSYGLIQELKGSFSAFMWQSMARLFGHNLKDQYDPNGKDRQIEMIVSDIECGLLPVKLPSRAELRAQHEPHKRKRK